MNDFDIPIFKKSYDLYKTFHEYRRVVPKQDRFTIFERSESAILEVIECIMQASGESKKEKLPTLERASLKLNTLRVFVRLMKDVKAIDGKKYINIESAIDEIGRMLGGWIRSVKAD
jgi:four helix bundle protein